MHVLGFRRALLTWSVLLFLLPAAAEAQLRPVVSSEVAVSGREAALRLEFQEGTPLSIALREGEAMVDGEVVGTYDRGDALDQAWRALLGQAISLSDGPLAQALVAWSPPEDVGGNAGEVALALDQALEEALTLQQEEGMERSGAAEATLSLAEEESLVGALLRRTGALEGLAEALEEASIENFSLRIGEDVEIGTGQELDRSLIVVDGDLDVRGTIRGDVVVTDGTVRIREGGRISGDLRVADGHVESMGGVVEGSILDLDVVESGSLGEQELEELREELRRDIRRDLLSSMERERDSGHLPGIFGNLGRAIGELMENLVTLAVLVILGVLTVHFGRSRLEVVATTVRRAPVQSGMVGMAGGFLLIPVWILGIVALAVSIIGIPVLLAWIPLFPLAAGLAAFVGYVAVARNVGEWVADQEYRGLEWIRGSNTFYVVVAGLATLMVPAVAASLIRIIGFGFLHGLLTFVGGIVTFLALAVGFGAVLMTRGGKIRPYAAYYDFEDEAWGEDEDVRYAQEPVREREPTSASGSAPAPEPEEGTGQDAGKAPGVSQEEPGVTKGEEDRDD